MTRRVITQGRFWPMRWQRSADCHSAAGFHQLDVWVSDPCLKTRDDGRNLRVDNENSAGLCKIKSDTSSLQTDEKHLDISVVHEVFDALLSLLRRHGAIKHDGVEACATQSPFDELEHRRELREDDRLEGLFVAAKFVQIVHKHLDLG